MERIIVGIRGGEREGGGGVFVHDDGLRKGERRAVQEREHRVGTDGKSKGIGDDDGVIAAVRALDTGQDQRGISLTRNGIAVEAPLISEAGASGGDVEGYIRTYEHALADWL